MGNSAMTDAEVPVVPAQSWHRWSSNTRDSWYWWRVSPWTRPTDFRLHSSTTSGVCCLARCYL